MVHSSVSSKPSTEDSNLCKRCRYSTIMRGNTMKAVEIFCEEIQEFLRFSVESCNRYRDILAKDEWDLRKDAWILEVKPNKKIGFISPLERKARKNRDDDY